MSKNNFTGYVLAGGKSSRMGKDKAFLEFNGKSFLENAVDALRPLCSSIKIVLNNSQTHFIKKIPDDITHIFDIFENRGALGGIHAAFNDCETEFAIVLAVDLPFVSSETIEKLCEIATTFEKYFAFVPQQNDGRLQPLCAIYRTKICLPELEKSLQQSYSVSAHTFLENMKTKFVAQKGLDKNLNLFFNVNTLINYEKIDTFSKVENYKLQ